MKKLTITSLTAAALALPVVSMATTEGQLEAAKVGTVGKGGAAATRLASILDQLGTWALIALGALATFYIIIAAFNFVTAQGEKGKIDNAKKEITYALIAIAIGAVAKLLTAIVGGLASGVGGQ